MDVLIGVKNLVYPDGVKLSDVAKWNEWGTQLIPPRPAFRMGAERALKTRKAQIQAALKNICLAKKRGDKKTIALNIRNVMTGIGQSAASEVKKIINSGETVHNAPATVAKKGFDHPLFETGVLAKNIIYEVQE